jgi:hypothetical protein
MVGFAKTVTIRSRGPVSGPSYMQETSLNAECPICHQMVRLHYNKAGRRHLFAHVRVYSRTLYEG